MANLSNTFLSFKISIIAGSQDGRVKSIWFIYLATVYHFIVLSDSHVFFCLMLPFSIYRSILVCLFIILFHLLLFVWMFFKMIMCFYRLSYISLVQWFWLNYWSRKKWVLSANKKKQVWNTIWMNYFDKTTYQEEFEDTKGVIRIRISKKDRQHNGKKKPTKGQRMI